MTALKPSPPGAASGAVIGAVVTVRADLSSPAMDSD
jgi:hypothetical protein